MTHLGYIVAGWGISIIAIGAYAVGIVRRGRVVAAQVPDERRRWMTTDD